MALEPAGGNSPSGPMQSITGRVVRLGGISALALLKADVDSGGSYETVALHGAISHSGFTKALACIAADGALSNAQAESLGIDLVQQQGQLFRIQDQQTGVHLGALLLALPHSAAATQPAQFAVELLRELALHEFRRDRELHVLRQAAHFAKALSARHVKTRERERLQLATELHNHLSQTLTVMRLSLAAMRKRAASSPDPPAELAELTALAADAASVVRDLTANLRPAMLDTAGLAAAIRREASIRESTPGPSIQCELEEFTSPEAVSLAAFRVVQESLRNALRHARATSIQIQLRQTPGTVHLAIADNGCGFDASKKGHSLGLLEIAERAELAGGSVIIESAPGAGTRIYANFPSKTADAAPEEEKV